MQLTATSLLQFCLPRSEEFALVPDNNQIQTSDVATPRGSAYAERRSNSQFQLVRSVRVHGVYCIEVVAKTSGVATLDIGKECPLLIERKTSVRWRYVVLKPSSK